MNPYAYNDSEFGAFNGFAADAQLSERVAFIRRTYMHVFASILAFVGLEALFFTTDLHLAITQLVGGNWILALIGFMVVSFVADKWAHSGGTPGKQYLGLVLYVVFESVIFVPLLFMAQLQSPNIIPTAAVLTLMVFGGLTFFVLITKQDFSFLRNVLAVGFIAALGIMVCSWLFGFGLGILFVAGMIVLLCGYILYETSNVLHHYHTDQHVGASLALFSSVATLFWYMIRLLSIFNDD